MYQIAYIGRWETLLETAAAICDHDTPKLEAMLQGGVDLNAPIQLSEYIKLTPLEIAVFRNDVPMIHFLLEHGADPGLAEEQPLLVTAARCCGPEVVALFAGRAAKLSPKQKVRAFQEAFQEVRWGKRLENIQVLEQAGITVDKFGGEAFRAAVSEGNTKLARLLLEKGADINYHKPDMVSPYASSPVTEAARSNNFPMVRWLVEHGANITLVDKYGDRPYSVAVQNKNQEMADYLKALEPEEWHNEQEKIRQLMPYKLPAKLVEHLKTGPLRLEFPEQKWVKWAELYSYMDVQEMTWKRKKLLSLMVQMDNYSDYLLLWSP
ncbi:MAG: ankyrin repeat domain-containing protein, partial [Clostridiaceae bacterium]|nr:ankyrin repeat domain-containing protein [Clostridiaceae bacterium]